MVLNVILPIGVFLLMFGLGLTLKVADFVRIATVRKSYLAGMASMLLVVPVFGFALVHAFDISPVLAMGIMLIATAPGGLFSNLMTHLGGGNLALSVALTASLSLAYIVESPFVVAALQSYFLDEVTAVRIPMTMVALPLLALTLTPLALGMIVAHRLPALAGRVEAPLRTASTVFVFAAYFALAWVERDNLVRSIQTVFLPVLLLNLGSVLVSYTISRLAGLPPEDTIAVTIEHSIRQEGTAIYIAATLLGSPQMALPLMVNGGVGLLLAGLFILISKRRATRPGASQKDPSCA